MKYLDTRAYSRKKYVLLRKMFSTLIVTCSGVLTFGTDVIDVNGFWVTITQLEIKLSSHCQNMSTRT